MSASEFLDRVVSLDDDPYERLYEHGQSGQGPTGVSSWSI